MILIELIPHGIELAARGSLGRLDHGDLLGLVTGGCVRATKIPIKEVADLPREDARIKSFCHKPSGYLRAIQLRSLFAALMIIPAVARADAGEAYQKTVGSVIGVVCTLKDGSM